MISVGMVKKRKQKDVKELHAGRCLRKKNGTMADLKPTNGKM